MARKLNSFIVVIGRGKHSKQIAVSYDDFERFNHAKDTNDYGKVCIDLVKKYSTVKPNDLWRI